MARSSTTWKGGQSGNPGGRRQKTDAEREAEQMFAEGSPKVVRKLDEMVETGMYNGEPLRAKEFATIAKLWLDHTRVGKEELAQLDLPDDPSDYTPDNCRAVIAWAQRRLVEMGAAAETGTEVH